MPLHVAKSLTGFKLATTRSNMQQGVQKTCNSNVWSCWPTMLRPVWDVMILLHDDVTVVGRASAFANWQFTYYNTHGSDWGTFALKTVFVLLSKQCIGFFSILLYCKSKPTSLWRWQHVKLLKLFFKNSADWKLSLHNWFIILSVIHSSRELWEAGWKTIL